jgi:hypothetical protein
MPRCYDLLEYYFSVAQNPAWKYFANYADAIIEKQDQQLKDQSERAERRNKAKEWLSE